MSIKTGKIAIWLNNKWLWLCGGQAMPTANILKLADIYGKQGYKINIVYGG